MNVWLFVLLIAVMTALPAIVVTTVLWLLFAVHSWVVKRRGY